MMEAIKLAEDIFCIKDFFTKEECEEYIEFSEKQGYELAKINMGFREQVVNTSVRNNERVIYDDEALAEELWLKVKPFVIPETKYGVACGLNERFRFYKYLPKQYFRLHKDGSFIRNTKEWSAYTLIIYLNDDLEGGDTTFPQFSVKPKAGAAIIFKHNILHAGEPVLSGVKYILRTDIMYRRKEQKLL